MKQLCILLVIIITGCADDIQPTYKYPDSIIPYVNIFKEEAKKRNVYVSTYSLEIIIQDSLINNYNAYYDTRSHKIYIDTTREVWRVQPEELLSHELGHAILKRDHLFGSFSGTWVRKSIMGNLGAVPLFSNPEFSYRRDYYYDELFNPSSLPDWL